jgi:DNA-binding transcriptional MerR regulator
VRAEVDVTTLVADPTKAILEGAVLPWNSGGRRLSMYAAGELGVRQIIRRLRDLDMPLEEIRAVLDASDVEIRNRVIANYLGRLETNLARTETAARALRDLLDGTLASPEIERRNSSAMSSMGEARTRSDPLPDVSCG